MEELAAGEEGWIQLELRDPVVAVRGDRYVLRRPSPGETIGGGIIIDHQPKGRHKRFDGEVLKSLESLAQGTPAEILLEAALALNIASIKDVINRSRLDPENATSALQELVRTDSLVTLEEGQTEPASDLLVVATAHWNSLSTKIFQTLSTYHEKFPLRRGIPREELKSRLKLTARVFNAVINKLIGQQMLADRSGFLAKPEHEITFDNGQQTRVQAMMRRFEQNPFSPPGVRECQAEFGEEVLNALVEMGQFVMISQDVLFRKEDYDSAVKNIRYLLTQQEKLTLAEVRDLFNTSRKYAQALLEHLDAIGLTIRDGDYRKLRRK
jgi:selenocysteine-specific elongation factor